MALIRSLAKQNGWRIVGTFIDEWNFTPPEKMYLLDRTYNWTCPFGDKCNSFQFSEPCLFRGKSMVCLRCCTDRFRVIWYDGTSSPTPTCATPNSHEHEDQPDLDLNQRSKIQIDGMNKLSLLNNVE